MEDFIQFFRILGMLEWWQTAIFIGMVVIFILIVSKKFGPKMKELSPYGNITGNNFAVIIFRQVFKITKINGNHVKLKPGFAKLGSFKIAPGNYAFEYSFDEDGKGSGSGLTANGSFESGKTYLLKAQSKKDGFLHKTMFAEFIESRGEEDINKYLKKEYLTEIQ